MAAYFTKICPEMVDSIYEDCFRKKIDKCHWKDLTLDEHAEFTKTMKLADIKRRILVADSIVGEKAQHFNSEVMKEYNRRVGIAINVILDPKEEEISKDELGVVYHTKTVNMRIRSYIAGSGSFKERMAKIRKRRVRKEKELEGIEELSEESDITSKAAESDKGSDEAQIE